MSQPFHVEASDKRFVEQLLSAIDSVHAVAGMTRVTIERKPLPNGWTGQFDPYTRTATISPDSRFPLTTGAHEIGHAIDAIYLVAAGNLGRLDGPITLYASQYATDGRGVLVDWYEAVKHTQRLREILAVLRKFTFMTPEWDDVQYYLRPAEIWARAYEQFIAQNTADENLLAEFKQKSEEEVPVEGQRFRV